MKKILLGLIIILLCSCSENIKSTDVQFVENEIIYNGAPFTGQVWSKDGKTVALDVSDGRIVKVTFFHDNGNPAAVGTLRLRNDGRTKRLYFEYFDINGYEMTEHEWETKYDYLLKGVDIEGEFPITFYD